MEQKATFVPLGRMIVRDAGAASADCLGQASRRCNAHEIEANDRACASWLANAVSQASRRKGLMVRSPVDCQTYSQDDQAKIRNGRRSLRAAIRRNVAKASGKGVPRPFFWTLEESRAPETDRLLRIDTAIYVWV